MMPWSTFPFPNTTRISELLPQNWIKQKKRKGKEKIPKRKLRFFAKFAGKKE